VLALLILVFIVVIIIDLLSLMIRSFVTDEGDVRRPSWIKTIRKTIFGSRDSSTEQ